MSDAAKDATAARRWFISGRVQGVGFRWFVERQALELGLRGYTRNLGDGRVEVYGIGTPEQLDVISGQLRVGPRMADVRGFEEQEAPVLEYEGFSIQ